MNDSYNFDRVYDRRNDDATKYAELPLKFGRSDLFPMWIADMDFAVAPAITETLCKVMSRPVLGYTTAPPAFFQAIANWEKKRHGWELDPSHVTFLPGVKKALGLCVNYFTKPGDKILIQPPVYHSFRSVITGNGRVAIDSPLKQQPDGSYLMDTVALAQLIEAEKPAMMIVCNPQNPIGIQWSAETLAEVADICHRNGVLLLSDEIYADLVFPGTQHIPTATVSETAANITVTLGSPSKSFNIPGLAVAWVAVQNEAIRTPFFEWLKASEFDTPPTCALYATIAAYTACEEWLDAMQAYIAANADFAIDYVATNMPGVKTVRPNAGFGLWLDFRGLGLTHDEITDMLVDKAHVAVNDGATFGKEGAGLARLNFGMPRGVLEKGLARIADAVKETMLKREQR